MSEKLSFTEKKQTKASSFFSVWGGDALSMCISDLKVLGGLASFCSDLQVAIQGTGVFVTWALF